MTATLPRGIRNHNPGNLERTKDRWLGMSADQSGDTRFLIFDTPEAGIRALMRVLINYRERHDITTLRAAINRWAPPAENNSTAYVQHVARLTGFDPDEPLDFLDKAVCVALTRAIIRHECGSPQVFGRAEWYDDATFERAAVMAGYPPEVKPLAKSRTMAGAAIAAAGTIAGAVAVANGAPPEAAATAVEATGVPITAQDVAAITAAVAPFLGASAMAVLSPIATLFGIGLTIYARYDDARKKIR